MNFTHYNNLHTDIDIEALTGQQIKKIFAKHQNYECALKDLDFNRCSDKGKKITLMYLKLYNSNSAMLQNMEKHLI